MRQDCNKKHESLLITTFETDFQAVHSRHHHIEKNNVAIAVGADFQGIDAVRRGQNLEIFGA
jgi:hypothetical protein